MARWILTNQHKKSVIERQYWMKDNMSFVIEEGFRWGTWETESDTKPEVDLENNLDWEPDEDWEMVNMVDGCWVEIMEWSDTISEEEQQRIENISSEGYFSALEEDGWINTDTEYIIQGPLVMKNENTGEIFEAGE